MVGEGGRGGGGRRGGGLGGRGGGGWGKRLGQTLEVISRQARSCGLGPEVNPVVNGLTSWCSDVSIR